MSGHTTGLPRRLASVLAAAALAVTLPQTAHAAETPADGPNTAPTAPAPADRAAEDRLAAEAELEHAAVPPGPLTFGAEALSSVESAAADAAAGASCGISAKEATAMALAPVWPEIVTGTQATPSPMTLSRFDNQAGLYDPAGRDGLFFNPGVGLWQMDSAGLGTDNTAGEAIDSAWVSGLVTPYIVDKYCSALNGGSSAPDARATAWSDWNACSGGECDTVYWRAFNDGVTADGNVDRYGGAEPRTCEYQGSTYDCLFVDIADAQGADWWAAPDAGRSPLPHPFYVLRDDSGGSTEEVRVFLGEDSGHGTDVTATRPFGGDARDSLTWTDGRGLCDTTEGRGAC
ncbi:hypothetical protein GCM10007147_22870 [Nocardiopsis kunsanensis]|uniref:Uncharacterized protein n=1 Tax=Nocardiopsis kunsanensis TaxID=141693 RepID=A0A918XD37_9ACTN|nr:hypothetical protein [Nocardiopsis kunsanensis]GHD25480.1 hypothetical protein GCM10007147_22870 [Nocardiopsis kunsanensis]